MRWFDPMIGMLRMKVYPLVAISVAEVLSQDK
jgi:hypothetical protein